MTIRKDPDGSDEYAPCERYVARDWVLFRPPPVRIVFQRQSAATTDVCPCMAPDPVGWLPWQSYPVNTLTLLCLLCFNCCNGKGKARSALLWINSWNLLYDSCRNAIRPRENMERVGVFGEVCRPRKLNWIVKVRISGVIWLRRAGATRGGNVDEKVSQLNRQASFSNLAADFYCVSSRLWGCIWRRV